MVIMKKLQVLHIDNDLVQKMDLQIGDNIIGRSVVTGCDDNGTIKHAVTINLTPDNEMKITPYQVAPCYIKTTESPRWQLLKLGASVPIKPGDICSLVPDKCWFKVISMSEKMENNQEETLKRKASNDVDYSTPGKKACLESGEGDNLGSPCDALSNILNNNNDEFTGKSEKNDTKHELIKCEETQSTMEEKSEGTCKPGSKDEVETQSTSSEPVPKHENADELPKEEEDTDKPPSANELLKRGATGEPNTSSATSGNVPRREKCRYGDKCYRRNPQHKAKFSHSGDADYDIPDDREECPYGSRCYRKNLQHKTRYKHTGADRKNVRTKRRRKRAPTATPSDTLSELSEEESEEESVDESEYEPSSDELASISDEDDEVDSDKNESDDDVVD